MVILALGPDFLDFRSDLLAVSQGFFLRSQQAPRVLEVILTVFQIVEEQFGVSGGYREIMISVDLHYVAPQFLFP